MEVVSETEEEVQQESLGFARLISVLLSPRTMPHLILLITVSLVLYQMVKGSGSSGESTAMAFISFSTAYVIIALAARGERWTDLVHTTSFKETDTKGASAFLIHQLQQTIKVWIPPLILASIIMISLHSVFGGDGALSAWAGGLPLALAFLFILWSMGQAISFRMTIKGFLIGKSSFSDSTERRPHLITSSLTQVILVQICGFLMLWAIQSAAVGGSVEPTLVLKEQFAYLLVLLAGQVGVLVWARPLRERASTCRGGGRAAYTMGLTIQLFAAWHLLSIWRRISDFGEPEVISTVEELTLMVLTIVLAIYGLSSRSLQVDSRWFTEQNALFWGLVFGFGYAGSISMISIFLDDVTTVLMFGHAITYLTLLYLHRSSIAELPWKKPPDPVELQPITTSQEELTTSDVESPEEEMEEVEEASDSPVLEDEDMPKDESAPQTPTSSSSSEETTSPGPPEDDDDEVEVLD